MLIKYYDMLIKKFDLADSATQMVDERLIDTRFILDVQRCFFHTAQFRQQHMSASPCVCDGDDSEIKTKSLVRDDSHLFAIA